LAWRQIYSLALARKGRFVAMIAVASILAIATLGANVGPDTALHVSTLTPTTTLIVAPTGNLVALTGSEGTVLIGMQAPSLTPRIRAALAAHGAPPVRWVIATAGDSAWAAGDAGWSLAGATVFMHERLAFARERRVPSGSALRPPRVGFSEVIQLLADDDAVHAVHQPGTDWAEASVHIEGAGVVYLGATFTTDGYPAIDTLHGGSLDSLIATTAKFTDFSPRIRMVPGRGPVGSSRELSAYHDMLAAVREKLRPFAEAKRPVADVIASNPTASFDAMWGHGPVSPRAFVTVAYVSLLSNGSR
jgi:cyclase